MQQVKCSLNNFYSCLCCEPQAEYPQPYTFEFGTDYHLNINQQRFQSNLITTTKYNAVNFIPSKKGTK